jgi:hypothetical protein
MFFGRNGGHLCSLVHTVGIQIVWYSNAQAFYKSDHSNTGLLVTVSFKIGSLNLLCFPNFKKSKQEISSFSGYQQI